MTYDIQFFKIPTGQLSRADICKKIDALELIISSLYVTAAVAVQHNDKIKYKIDTGQTKMEVEYTTPAQVTAAIDAYERLAQKLRNKLSPRIVRRMNGKNFRG